jgi:hypothetical protein
MQRGTAMRGAAATVLIGLSMGCSSTPTARVSPTQASTTPSAIATTLDAPSATATASPSPRSSASLRPVVRTKGELRKALFVLDDLPPGFESAPGDGEAGKASSPRPTCAPLVKLLNAGSTPGALVSTDVSFSGGEDGPDIQESLDAFGRASAANAYVDRFRTAVGNCASVTYSIPGSGTSTLHARRISFTAAGDDSFAARFSATSGALDGFDVIQVGVAAQDVVVGLAFFEMDPADAQDATDGALDKVTHLLSTGTSTS